MMTMTEMAKIISGRPGLWVFLCVVVVVGGPTFLNQTADRIWPTATQAEIAKDIEWIERRSNQFNPVLQNQKRMIELLVGLESSFRGLQSNVVGIDLRVARIEAWRNFPQTPTPFQPTDLPSRSQRDNGP